MDKPTQTRYLNYVDEILYELEKVIKTTNIAIEKVSAARIDLVRDKYKTAADFDKVMTDILSYLENL